MTPQEKPAPCQYNEMVEDAKLHCPKHRLLKGARKGFRCNCDDLIAFALAWNRRADSGKVAEPPEDARVAEALKAADQVNIVPMPHGHVRILAAAYRSELAKRREAEAECVEQARLNGMGSEREAALIARAEGEK